MIATPPWAGHLVLRILVSVCVLECPCIRLESSRALIRQGERSLQRRQRLACVNEYFPVPSICPVYVIKQTMFDDNIIYHSVLVGNWWGEPTRFCQPPQQVRKSLDTPSELAHWCCCFVGKTEARVPVQELQYNPNYLVSVAIIWSLDKVMLKLTVQVVRWRLVL